MPAAAPVERVEWEWEGADVEVVEVDDVAVEVVRVEGTALRG